MKKALSYILVFLFGMIIMVPILYFVMPGMMPNVMIKEYQSQMEYQETINTIDQRLQEKDWIIVDVHDIQNTIMDAGFTDLKKMTLFLVYKPEFLYKMMQPDEFKKFTAMMPAGIGVYEKSDGQIYISMRNVKLMGRIFGQGAEEVTLRVAEEWIEILDGIIEEENE